MPPKDPQDLDKVNYIIDSWCRPCDAPWYIYIETLKPAALAAFIVLISFGWADVLRGLLRPAGLGRRSKKKKGKGTKYLRGFPEVGNTLGKKLPFAEQVSEWITWGTKTKFLWRIDNAMQAGLFMWLIVDVVEDFLFDWTSLLYKTYWCRESYLGRFSWSKNGVQSRSGNVWWKESYTLKDYQTSPPLWTGNAGNSGPNGCKAFATAAFKQIVPFAPPSETGVRIYDSVTFQKYGETVATDIPPQFETSLVCKGDVPPNTLFRVAVFHDAAWADVGNGVVAAFENEAH